MHHKTLDTLDPCFLYFVKYNYQVAGHLHKCRLFKKVFQSCFYAQKRETLKDIPQIHSDYDSVRQLEIPIVIFRLHTFTEHFRIHLCTGISIRDIENGVFQSV